MHQPVIIIGAARCGTNMLRDVLTSLPQVGTWPCDEINAVWRHGNLRCPVDEFSPEQARPEVRRFVRRTFDRLARRQCLGWVVEKTCANSLRVAFVDSIFPEAKYIFLIRNGWDVVASAMKRWRSAPDLRYLAKKARFVPLQDVPYYAGSYSLNQLYRLASRQRRLATWGPRFQGMHELLAQRSLAEVCALQWQRSVEKADQEFSAIEASRVYRLRYEDFVARPLVELDQLRQFLGLQASDFQIARAIGHVSSRRIGAGRRELDAETQQLIQPHLETVHARFYPEGAPPGQGPSRSEDHGEVDDKQQKAA